MKCPKCAETIDDQSAFCAFCGETLGQKYCAKCGGHLEKSSSGAQGFVITVFIVAAITLLVLQVSRHGETASPLKAQAIPGSAEAQKPYTIISSDETTFADHTLISVSVRVSPFVKRNGILLSARDIARSEMMNDTSAIIDIRMYITDDYRTDPDSWEAHAIAVDMKQHPTFRFPADHFEDMGDNLFIRWKE